MPSFIALLITTLCLLPVTAQAREGAAGAAEVMAPWCLTPKEPGGASPLLTPKVESPRLLLTAAAEKNREPGGLANQRWQLRDHGDLIAVAFSAHAPITPWFGAGIDLESEAAPPAFRLGAGFGCALGNLTRLHFGYGFSSLLDLELGDPTAADDEERHHFTVGLEKSF